MSHNGFDHYIEYAATVYLRREVDHNGGARWVPDYTPEGLDHGMDVPGEYLNGAVNSECHCGDADACAEVTRQADAMPTPSLRELYHLIGLLIAEESQNAALQRQ